MTLGKRPASPGRRKDIQIISDFPISTSQHRDFTMLRPDITLRNQVAANARAPACAAFAEQRALSQGRRADLQRVLQGSDRQGRVAGARGGRRDREGPTGRRRRRLQGRASHRRPGRHEGDTRSRPHPRVRRVLLGGAGAGCSPATRSSTRITSWPSPRTGSPWTSTRRPDRYARWSMRSRMCGSYEPDTGLSSTTARRRSCSKCGAR